MPDNEERLNIKEMSIEQTHLILMAKGIEAEEFNIGETTDFGNYFTKMEVQFYNIYFFLQDGTFQYYVLYFGVSILGFQIDQLYYSFHLLDVVVKFPALANVVKAVTMNANQLAWTFLLMAITIYIFTTISFFYMQDTVVDTSFNGNDATQVGENTCRTMLQCFMSMTSYGMLKGGGIGDVTQQVNYGEDLQLYWIKFSSDLGFFIIVKIIIMNILFGIIIDTFAQLRDQKKFRDEDMANICFICSFDRFTFDKNSEGGFTRHIAKDHHLWFYVYYVVHLQAKDPTELTGIESYVSNCYNEGIISWMPRQKALCLDASKAGEEEDELGNLREELKKNTELLSSFNERLDKVLEMVEAEKKE